MKTNLGISDKDESLNLARLYIVFLYRFIHKKIELTVVKRFIRSYDGRLYVSYDYDLNNFLYIFIIC